MKPLCELTENELAEVIIRSKLGPKLLAEALHKHRAEVLRLFIPAWRATLEAKHDLGLEIVRQLLDKVERETACAKQVLTWAEEANGVGLRGSLQRLSDCHVENAKRYAANREAWKRELCDIEATLHMLARLPNE